MAEIQEKIYLHMLNFFSFIKQLFPNVKRSFSNIQKVYVVTFQIWLQQSL